MFYNSARQCTHRRVRGSTCAGRPVSVCVRSSRHRISKTWQHPPICAARLSRAKVSSMFSNFHLGPSFFDSVVSVATFIADTWLSPRLPRFSGGNGTSEGMPANLVKTWGLSPSCTRGPTTILPQRYTKAFALQRKGHFSTWDRDEARTYCISVQDKSATDG